MRDSVPTILVSAVQKWYGKQHVLKGIDVAFSAGEIVVLMGPNGSGKSTLIKSIVGLVHPDSGSIEVMGIRAESDGVHRRLIGYMPQIARYPESLTVAELFGMMQRLRNDCSSYDRELYEALDIAPLERKPLGSLSGGQRQRVSAALAFYFSPQILLLDEPTAGLDPLSTELVKAKLRSAKESGKTVLLTTHSPQDALELADRLVYLYDGTVRIDAALQALMATSGCSSLMGAIAWHLQREGVR